MAQSANKAPASRKRIARSPGDWILLGSIATTAPKAALTRALRQLRPQCAVRLEKIADNPNGARYRVELQRQDDVPSSIDAWLRIKSALLAAFPADKPHAVEALDPTTSAARGRPHT